MIVFYPHIIKNYWRTKKHEDELKSDVSALKQGQLRLETHLENEAIEKIRALFEDQSINQDYFASMQDSLARIEERVGFFPPPKHRTS